MKKLLFALPVLLVLAFPVMTFAKQERDNNSNSSHLSINVGQGHGESSEEHTATNSLSHQEKENENENENEGNELKINHGSEESFEHESTIAARIKLGLGNPAGRHISTNSAKVSATPSAHLNLNIHGPLDQVIKVLENILNFLKGLV